MHDRRAACQVLQALEILLGSTVPFLQSGGGRGFAVHCTRCGRALLEQDCQLVEGGDAKRHGLAERYHHRSDGLIAGRIADRKGRMAFFVDEGKDPGFAQEATRQPAEEVGVVVNLLRVHTPKIVKACDGVREVCPRQRARVPEIVVVIASRCDAAVDGKPVDPLLLGRAISQICKKRPVRAGGITPKHQHAPNRPQEPRS